MDRFCNTAEGLSSPECEKIENPILDCKDFDALQDKLVANKKETAAKLDKLQENHAKKLLQIFGSTFDAQTVLNYKQEQIKSIKVEPKIDLNNSTDTISKIKNNPDIMLKLTDCQLNYVLRWKEVIDGLDHDTLHKIMMSEEITERIQKNIPHSTFAMFIQIRPDFIETINSTSPGIDYVSTLLREESFISKLNVRFIGRMLEKIFVNPLFRGIKSVLHESFMRETFVHETFVRQTLFSAKAKLSLEWM